MSRTHAAVSLCIAFAIALPLGALAKPQSPPEKADAAYAACIALPSIDGALIDCNALQPAKPKAKKPR